MIEDICEFGVSEGFITVVTNKLLLQLEDYWQYHNKSVKYRIPVLNEIEIWLNKGFFKTFLIFVFGKLGIESVFVRDSTARKLFATVI